MKLAKADIGSVKFVNITANEADRTPSGAINIEFYLVDKDNGDSYKIVVIPTVDIQDHMKVKYYTFAFKNGEEYKLGLACAVASLYGSRILTLSDNFDIIQKFIYYLTLALNRGLYDIATSTLDVENNESDINFVMTHITNPFLAVFHHQYIEDDIKEIAGKVATTNNIWNYFKE